MAKTWHFCHFCIHVVWKIVSIWHHQLTECSYLLFKNCSAKNSKNSKSHNSLIFFFASNFHQIFIFCLEFVYSFIEMNFILLWTWLLINMALWSLPKMLIGMCRCTTSTPASVIRPGCGMHLLTVKIIYRTDSADPGSSLSNVFWMVTLKVGPRRK